VHKNIFTIFLLIVTQGVYGQSTINATQFLKKSVDAFNDSSSSGQFTTNNQQEFSPAWIDEMEFRTETDEFDFGRQEYTFRVSPLTPKIRKAQKDLMAAYRLKLRPDQFEAMQNKVELAYETWLDAFTTQQKIETYKKLLVIYQDQQKVIKRQINQPEFRVESFLDIKEDINDLNIRMNQQESKLADLQMLLNELAGENIQPNWEALPSTNDVIAIINQAVDPQNLDRSRKAEEQVDQQILQKEQELEMAEKNQIIDFVQARYSGPHDDIFREKVSIGVGINIPTAGSRKLKLEELKLDMAREANALKLRETEILADLKSKRNNILQTIREYDIYKELKAEEIKHTATIVDGFAQRQGFSPKLLLEVNELKIKDELKQIELRDDIYERYIDYIIASGMAFQIPYVNYLSAGLESF